MRDDEFMSEPKSNSLVVIFLIALASLTFSYLGAYALPEVLVASQVIGDWSHDHDPRPHWMLIIFIGIFGSLFFTAALARVMSGRQLRRIDAMGEA